MTQHNQTIRDVLLEQYYRGKDGRGFSDAELNQALAQIKKIIEEEVIGEDTLTERNGLLGVTHKDENNNELRAEQRANLNKVMEGDPQADLAHE